MLVHQLDCISVGLSIPVEVAEHSEEASGKGEVENLEIRRTSANHGVSAVLSDSIAYM
jgi:hypothetical protein